MTYIKFDRYKFSKFILSIDILPILICLIVIFLFFGIYEPKFLSGSNMVNIFRNSSYLIIVAIGQMLVLIMQGFDLSVGSVMALSSITTAITMVEVGKVYPEHLFLIMFCGIVAALIVGSLVGIVNGVCVAFLRVPAFMVTVATSSISTGIALSITTGVPIYGMPDEFTRGLAQLKLLNLPIIIFIAFFIVIILWFIMNWTKLGKYFYAVGGNEFASHVSGIRTRSYIVLAFIMSSFLSAIAGVLLTARVGSGEGTMGGNYVMDSIAAAVLGGVSLRGGTGKVGFVVIGALFLTIVTNGMNLIRVDSKIQTIVVGIVLIIAVALDGIKNKGALQ